MRWLLYQATASPPRFAEAFHGWLVQQPNAPANPKWAPLGHFAQPPLQFVQEIGWMAAPPAELPSHKSASYTLWTGTNPAPEAVVEVVSFAWHVQHPPATRPAPVAPTGMEALHIETVPIPEGLIVWFVQQFDVPRPVRRLAPSDVSALHSTASFEQIVWGTGLPFMFAADEWATRFFRVRTRMRATSGTAYARIYDVTSAAQLVQVSTTSATFSHLTSTTVTLTDTREYRVDFGVSSGGSGEWTYWDVFEVLV